MKSYKVKVVVPLYKESLTELEVDTLINNMKVLSSHKFVLLFPDNLDFSSIKNLIDVSSCDIKFVSGDWLGKKKGVEGYNKMMMSKYFYKLFSDTEYILICQTDAFIFREVIPNAGYLCIVSIFSIFDRT